jgi:hypothetical protein
MKRSIVTTTTVMGLLVALCAGDLFAAGRGNGGNGGKGGGSRTGASAAQVTRPADSQRRDGTFLTSGVTANGSTTRPGNGKGLQDGSRLASTPTPAPATAP